MVMVMCFLDSLDALKVQRRDQVQISLEPLEILKFINGGFVPMNEMCERAGMSERQIFDRTKAVFGYFNLPLDEQAAAYSSDHYMHLSEIAKIAFSTTAAPLST
jgi:hypothetical protein